MTRVNNRILLDECEEIKVHLQQQIDDEQNEKKIQVLDKYITSYIDDELRLGFQIWMFDSIRQQHSLNYWHSLSTEKPWKYIGIEQVFEAERELQISNDEAQLEQFLQCDEA